MTATSAIIPASGLGRRLSQRADKAFVNIAGRPLLAHTLAVFQDSPDIDEIVLVVRQDQLTDARALVDRYSLTKVNSIVTGGETRQDSVRNGLQAVSPHIDVAAIHDAARPFVTPELIRATIDAAVSDGAAVAAVPAVDTIKSSPDGRFVEKTLDRSSLFVVQTPQTFRLDLIQQAYRQSLAEGFTGTDDASLVEHIGVPVRLVMGSYDNIKITTPVDLAIAEVMMTAKAGDRP